jgi:hypothetical protein
MGADCRCLCDRIWADLVCFSPFTLCLLDSISRSSWPKRRNADDDSWQDESFRSKFPPRFLQDPLLGFFEVRRGFQGSRYWMYRWTRHRICFYYLCKAHICTLHPLAPYCRIASYIYLAVICHLPPYHVFTEFLLFHLHHLSQPLPPLSTYLAYHYTPQCPEYRNHRNHDMILYMLRSSRIRPFVNLGALSRRDAMGDTRMMRMRSLV